MTIKIIPTILLAITLSQVAQAQLITDADYATITTDSVYIKKWTPPVLATAPRTNQATAAFNYTCRNTVVIIDGKYLYTASICTGQAPATQNVLDSMTFESNNPG